METTTTETPAPPVAEGIVPVTLPSMTVSNPYEPALVEFAARTMFLSLVADASAKEARKKIAHKAAQNMETLRDLLLMAGRDALGLIEGREAIIAKAEQRVEELIKLSREAAV